MTLVSARQAAQRPVLPGPGARPHVAWGVLLAAALAALTGAVWGVSSPSSGVAHLDRMRSSRASCRRAGCPRHSVGGGARSGIDDVLDTPDAPAPKCVVDRVQPARHHAMQLLLQPGLVEGGRDDDPRQFPHPAYPTLYCVKSLL